MNYPTANIAKNTAIRKTSSTLTTRMNGGAGVVPNGTLINAWIAATGYPKITATAITFFVRDVLKTGTHGAAIAAIWFISTTVFRPTTGFTANIVTTKIIRAIFTITAMNLV